jgi:lysophospholipase L1-like esterase
MSAIASLTPQMAAYSANFADSGEINWLPYLMYFHPFSYRSDVVSTDSYGFRYSEVRGRRYSATDNEGVAAVRIIAGSSTVFGIGASADRHTLASRMSENDRGDALWVNFGGRSFNSTQELILFCLHRHLLPQIKQIVLFSGFNDLGLARLPERFRKQHGAFFNCRDFFDALEPARASAPASWFKSAKSEHADDDIPAMPEQISYATTLTLRNLDVWRILAAAHGAELTFVLQPLANWVRSRGSAEEEALFAELERRGRFAEVYGDILNPNNHRIYADRLRAGAEAMGVRFVDMAGVVNACVPADRWLYVDRIHFTDEGNDIVAKALLAVLNQGERTCAP